MCPILRPSELVHPCVGSHVSPVLSAQHTVGGRGSPPNRGGSQSPAASSPRDSGETTHPLPHTPPTLAPSPWGWSQQGARDTASAQQMLLQPQAATGRPAANRGSRHPPLSPPRVERKPKQGTPRPGSPRGVEGRAGAGSHQVNPLSHIPSSRASDDLFYGCSRAYGGAILGPQGGNQGDTRSPEHLN